MKPRSQLIIEIFFGGVVLLQPLDIDNVPYDKFEAIKESEKVCAANTLKPPKAIIWKCCSAKI